MNKIKRLIIKITPKIILDIYASKILKQQIHIHKRIANISYSQQSEDLVLLKYFGRIWGGFYIDVGAYHPYQFSNTYIFYKMGWHGINIEPNPDNFEVISKKRKRDINLNIGISNEAKTQKYFKFNYPVMNTFIDSVAKNRDGLNGAILESTIEVKTKTLSTVLDKYLPSGQKIDFISIDAEGMDYDVLISNDWSKYRPKIILVEESIYEMGKFSDSKIYTYLESIGYKLWYVNGGSLFFEDIKNVD